MTRFIQICAGIALLAVATAFLSLAWTVRVLGNHSDMTLTGVDLMLTEVNRPCRGPDGPEACGLLASFNKTQNTTRNTVGQAEMIIRHFNDQKKLKAVDRGIAQLYLDLHRNMVNIDGGITDMRGTITALTGTVNAATSTVQESGRAIADSEPLLSATTGSIVHFDSSLQALTPPAQKALQEIAESAEQGTGVMTDTHKVADHFEKVIDDPKKSPWYIRMLPSVAQEAIKAMFEKWAVQ